MSSDTQSDERTLTAGSEGVDAEVDAPSEGKSGGVPDETSEDQVDAASDVTGATDATLVAQGSDQDIRLWVQVREYRREQWAKVKTRFASDGGSAAQPLSSLTPKYNPEQHGTYLRRQGGASRRRGRPALVVDLPRCGALLDGAARLGLPPAYRLRPANTPAVIAATTPTAIATADTTSVHKAALTASGITGSRVTRGAARDSGHVLDSLSHVDRGTRSARSTGARDSLRPDWGFACGRHWTVGPGL
jgi:hypothetical protein